MAWAHTITITRLMLMKYLLSHRQSCRVFLSTETRRDESPMSKSNVKGQFAAAMHKPQLPLPATQGRAIRCNVQRQRYHGQPSPSPTLYTCLCKYNNYKTLLTLTCSFRHELNELGKIRGSKRPALSRVFELSLQRRNRPNTKNLQRTAELLY